MNKLIKKLNLLYCDISNSFNEIWIIGMIAATPIISSSGVIKLKIINKNNQSSMFYLTFIN